MTASTFQTTKLLRTTLTLGAPGAVFPVSGGNTLTLTNLRTVAGIESVVRFATQCDLNIYGMHQEDMNALTVLFFGPTPSVQLNNTVQVEANGGDGWTQVFAGTIIHGSPDYRSVPDVPFHIQAMFGYFAGAAKTTPLSYPNGATVASAVQTIANTMGLVFQNNGVTATISPGSYFPGSPWEQMRTICSSYDVDWYDENFTLIIAPKGQPRQNMQLAVLTPQSGLIGYPRIEVGGIGIDAYFNSAILNGALVQVSGTDVPAANGIWLPYSITHTLESWVPGGRWQSSMHCLWQPGPSKLVAA